MFPIQQSILSENTKHARHLFFSLLPDCDIRAALTSLNQIIDTDNTVVGLGESLLNNTNAQISGIKTMPAQTCKNISIPSTPYALWCCLIDTDRGALFHLSNKIEHLLASDFILEDAVDCFQYDENRDLSGYIDGTENPEGDEAVQAGIVQDDSILNGSSYVAIQQWLHDFDQLDNMSQKEKDDTIGRHQSDNEEFDEAPESAHVKRSAQESFTPEAFILRRSMPWSEGMHAGLMFISYGHSFDAFEAILNRMIGKDDGIVDSLFKFTKPISGSYFWCPPAKDGKLDLSFLE